MVDIKLQLRRNLITELIEFLSPNNANNAIKILCAFFKRMFECMYGVCTSKRMYGSVLHLGHSSGASFFRYEQVLCPILSRVIATSSQRMLWVDVVKICFSLLRRLSSHLYCYFVL